MARLTQTPISSVGSHSPVQLLIPDHEYGLQHNTSTNGTLDDNPVTFPLDGRSLYVDATHEVVVLES